MLPGMPPKIKAGYEAVKTNARFLKVMLEDITGPEGPPHYQKASARAEEMQAQDTRCDQSSSLFFSTNIHVKMCSGKFVSENLSKSFLFFDHASSSFAINRTDPMDVDKVRYILKNLVRDWSAGAHHPFSLPVYPNLFNSSFVHQPIRSHVTTPQPTQQNNRPTEGAPERAASYGRMMTEIKARLGTPLQVVPEDTVETIPRILVPGCGLGRLMVDLACLGFEVQGNEFSYYMLLASSYMLNKTTAANNWTVYPWVHSNLNHLRDSDQLRGVTIPDLCPADALHSGGLLSMCAGDFVEVYGGEAER